MVTAVHQRLQEMTERITARSRDGRKEYMARIERARQASVTRKQLFCRHLANGFAGRSSDSKKHLLGEGAPNFAIVSAYSEMLSAYQPCLTYLEIIRNAAHNLGAEVQFSDAVSALCRGMAQGQDGAGFSHNVFDGILYVGVCDKVVPNLLIDALLFGHLPAIWVPAGTAATDLPNSDKVSTHQILMEIMGLQLPGSSFVNPELPLSDALICVAVEKLNDCTKAGQLTPLANVMSVKTVVNGMVGLLATGGSTYHSIYMIAVAKAAGITIDSQDFADLSAIVPLLCRIYPNVEVGIQHFYAAGGMPFLVQELLKQGLLHEDVRTVFGEGLQAYRQEPFLVDGAVQWRPCPAESLDNSLLPPFSAESGLALRNGAMGRAVIKVSAVRSEHRKVAAPGIAFSDQGELSPCPVLLANQ